LSKRVGKKENPLEVGILSEELNLRFERLSFQFESRNETGTNEQDKKVFLLFKFINDLAINHIVLFLSQ
jgi:hypothetical protein